MPIRWNESADHPEALGQRACTSKLPTLLVRPKSFREVGCLAVDPLGVSQHFEEEAGLAQEAILPWARCPYVTFGQLADGPEIPQHLEQRVGIGVEDVGFQSAVCGLVVESGDMPSAKTKTATWRPASTHSKSKSSTPNLLYLISTLR